MNNPDLTAARPSNEICQICEAFDKYGLAGIELSLKDMVNDFRRDSRVIINDNDNIHYDLHRMQEIIEKSGLDKDSAIELAIKPVIEKRLKFNRERLIEVLVNMRATIDNIIDELKSSN